MPSTVTATEVGSSALSDMGRAAFDLISKRIPWGNIPDTNLSFVERIMFVPKADGGVMLDEFGAPMLTDLGKRLYQQSGGDEMLLLDLTREISGDDLRRTQGAVYGKDGSIIAVNEPDEPFESVVSNLRKDSPRGSLQNPRDMFENVPRSSDRPEPVDEFAADVPRPGTQQLGQEPDLIPPNESVDELGATSFTRNPFLMGPLLSSPVLLGGAYLYNKEEEERKKGLSLQN